MELNITCRFMSIEEKRLPDATLYVLNVFIDGKARTLYLAQNNAFLRDFNDMDFGETITIRVSFDEHPKVANAYKMKFKGLV